ncbi:hypothetical protein FOCG_10338 [Fusarium oxysporum f. sp. radicis-lycopersici 26381]|nr:hypothetical protein FOCG_10338 [Fusarium oxysporum f. sp. radicis-lycopersici 26381]
MIGFDGSLIGGLLAITQWLKDLGLPNANQQGLMIAAQSLGGLIGSLPTSYLMDKIGRRRSLFWEISWSLVQLQGRRFVDHRHHKLVHDLSSTPSKPLEFSDHLSLIYLGVGIVICLCAVPVLITELAHPRQRGTVGSLFGSFFFLGAIVSAWIAFGTRHILSSWSWQILTLMQILSAVI